MSPTVSVIIPCYNTGQFLREAIESSLVQTYPHREVIVVDDGSTDDSASVADSYPQVRLICQSNAGVSAARNRATAEAVGELVVYLDADDRLHPEALQIGIDCFRDHPDCGFVFGFGRAIEADGAVRPSDPSAPVNDAGYAAMLAGHILVPPACAMFRRDAALKAGGFPVGVKLAEDYDMYLRVARLYPVFCHNQVVVDYRQHPGNACRLSPLRTLRGAHQALERQRDSVRGTPELELALHSGLRHWGRIFGPGMSFELLRSIRRGRLLHAAAIFFAVLRYYPEGFPLLVRHQLRNSRKSRG